MYWHNSGAVRLTMATFCKKAPCQWHARIRRKGWPQQPRIFNTQTEAITRASVIEREMDADVFVSHDETEVTSLAWVRELYAKEVTSKQRLRAVAYPGDATSSTGTGSLASVRGTDMASDPVPPLFCLVS